MADTQPEQQDDDGKVHYLLIPKPETMAKLGINEYGEPVESPHASSEDYVYRAERFKQFHRMGAQGLQFDPEKGKRGFAFPYKTEDNDTKSGVIPHTNGQVQLLDGGLMMIQTYKNPEEGDSFDSSKGFYADDIAGLLLACNQASVSNPFISGHERVLRSAIAGLLEAVLLCMDEIAQQKHGYSQCEKSRAANPVAAAEGLRDKLPRIAAILGADVIGPILLRALLRGETGHLDPAWVAKYQKIIDEGMKQQEDVPMQEEVPKKGDE